MTVRSHWLNRVMLAVLWPAITAGVAFLVARYAVDEDATDGTAPLPLIAASEREPFPSPSKPSLRSSPATAALSRMATNGRLAVNRCQPTLVPEDAAR